MASFNEYIIAQKKSGEKKLEGSDRDSIVRIPISFFPSFQISFLFVHGPKS